MSLDTLEIALQTHRKLLHDHHIKDAITKALAPRKTAARALKTRSCVRKLASAMSVYENGEAAGVLGATYLAYLEAANAGNGTESVMLISAELAEPVKHWILSTGTIWNWQRIAVEILRPNAVYRRGLILVSAIYRSLVWVSSLARRSKKISSLENIWAR